jgi:peptide/nickel transport system permease protein
MRKFLIKRIALSIIILFFVAFIIYTIMRCMPSSYVENMARQKASLPGGKTYTEWLAQLNATYHMDSGILSGCLQGA